MSSNVGLTTPRGSGTSGYVQRNLSVLRPRISGYGAPYPPRNSSSFSNGDGSPSLPSSLPRQRQPDRAILAHDREREVEVEVLELRDRLEEEGGLDEELVERRCDELRTRLLRELDSGRSPGRGNRKGLKPHQVHDLAEAKIKETEMLRKALGIKEERVGRTWEDNATTTPTTARAGAGDEGGKERGDARVGDYQG